MPYFFFQPLVFICCALASSPVIFWRPFIQLLFNSTNYFFTTQAPITPQPSAPQLLFLWYSPRYFLTASVISPQHSALRLAHITFTFLRPHLKLLFYSVFYISALPVLTLITFHIYNYPLFENFFFEVLTLNMK